MSGTEFRSSEQTESAPDPGGAESTRAEPSCVALVPIASPLRWETARPCLSGPDPYFVTQLIATAEQAPQTRVLRRATPADAEAAYRSVTDHNHTAATGIRTLQTS